MVNKLEPQVRAFSELEPYEQNEPGIAHFHWVLKENEIPSLCSGHVELEGPIHQVRFRQSPARLRSKTSRDRKRAEDGNRQNQYTKDRCR